MLRSTSHDRERRARRRRPRVARPRCGHAAFPQQCWRSFGPGARSHQFENVTGKAGLTTRLDQNPTPDKNMVETMAGGLAVFDYDGDGFSDIFFTNGAQIPSLTKSGPAQWNRLFRNRGDLTFEDVTERAGVAGEGLFDRRSRRRFRQRRACGSFRRRNQRQPSVSQPR